jgi:hypothetical protein
MADVVRHQWTDEEVEHPAPHVFGGPLRMLSRAEHNYARTWVPENQMVQRREALAVDETQIEKYDVGDMLGQRRREVAIRTGLDAPPPGVQ